MLPNKVGELVGNKTAEAVTKSNDNKIVKQDPVEEKIFHQIKERKYETN